METIDVSKLKRNPEAIKKILKTVDNMIVTKEHITVLFPKKFVDKEITILGNTCFIMGIIAILDDKGNYSVMNIPARLETQPAEIDDVMINDTLYVRLQYEKDTDFISNKKIVKETNAIFKLFDLLIIQGKIPWYLGYYDVMNIFPKLKKYTGSNAGNDVLAFEVMTAIIARDPEDKTLEYRLTIKNQDYIKKVKPAWVGMSNIFYTFRSTLNKLAGSYMKLGIVSAINHPESEISTLEHIIRE